MDDYIFIIFGRGRHAQITRIIRVLLTFKQGKDAHFLLEAAGNYFRSRAGGVRRAQHFEMQYLISFSRHNL